jgi:Fur family peroxide stress response transcriptional regulator
MSPLESLKRACREAGVPVTVQRRLVFETVTALPGHPTADEVHRAVARRQPGISRATVYRTLEGLASLRLIQKACHPGRAGRYDARLERHHHLVCVRCDTIADISDSRLDRLSLPDTSAEGFEVLDHSVLLRGICRHCQQEEKRR